MEANLKTDVRVSAEPHVCVEPFSYAVLALPLSNRKKFIPDPLIVEGANGEIQFVETAAFVSPRSREQARLLYSKGHQETQLVRAMRWREVEERYVPEEIANAEEIVKGR